MPLEVGFINENFCHRLDIRVTEITIFDEQWYKISLVLLKKFKNELLECQFSKNCSSWLAKRSW